MKPLSAFLPYILPSAPGCPTPTAYQALQLAAYEFCTLTDIVQVTYRVPAVADRDSYDFEPLEQHRACRLLEAFYGTKPLGVGVLDQINDAPALVGADGGAEVLYGEPRAAFLRAPSALEVGVAPVPQAPLSSTDFFFRVACAPEMNATVLADELFNNWLEPVAAGAIAKLQDTPGQMFTANSAGKRQRFLRGVSEARAESRRARVRGSMRVAGRGFV